MPAKFDKLQVVKNGYATYEQYSQTKCAGYINTTDGGSFRYFHIKTNVGGDESMWIADIVGYNYGLSRAIRTSIAWHSSGGGIYNVAGSSVSTSGLDPVNVYAAGGDSKSVLVFLGSSVYYCGFTLNLYSTRANASAQTDPSIIAWTLTDNSSPVY